MTKKELLAKKAEHLAEIEALWGKFNALMEQGLDNDDFRVQTVLNNIGGLEWLVEEIEEELADLIHP